MREKRPSSGADPSSPGPEPSLNVLGEPLHTCSTDPLTGFFRTGCCDTGPWDRGRHTICAVMTTGFLEFTKSRGNDLSAPRPEFGFPGLKPGDRWCLCALRWLEAWEAGEAPPVSLRATHLRTLDLVPLEVLKQKAMDLC